MSVLLAEGVVGSVGTFLSTHTGLVAAAVHGKKEEKGTNLKKDISQLSNATVLDAVRRGRGRDSTDLNRSLNISIKVP